MSESNTMARVLTEYSGSEREKHTEKGGELPPMESAPTASCHLLHLAGPTAQLRLLQLMSDLASLSLSLSLCFSLPFHLSLFLPILSWG